MTRLLLIFCLLFPGFLAPTLAAAENEGPSAQELFMRGNIAYGNGAFLEAEQAYREVLDKGHSAEVHYNLGNALAQQNKWSEAAFHYMKAYSLKPNFEPARANLLLAAEKMGLSEDYPTLSSPANLISEANWTLVAAISFWLALVFFFHRDFVSFTIPLSKTLGILSILGLLVSVFAIIQHELFKDWAVVSSPVASLRVAPAEESPGESVLIKGDPIRILGEQAGFYHVMTAAGDEGYILLSEIHPLVKD
jgi:tetratricopeptide (TPR) repeat protein